MNFYMKHVDISNALIFSFSCQKTQEILGAETNPGNKLSENA